VTRSPESSTSPSRALPLAPPRPSARPAVAGWRGRAWFNLTRAPRVVADLVREAGLLGAVRVVLAFAAPGDDPLAALGPAGDAAERLSRRQLAMVLRLERALVRVLGDAAGRAALERVVTRAGARFLRFSLRLPDARGWARIDAPARRDLVARSMAPFFNMQAEPVDALDAPGAEVAFDVRACWFARLNHELGRQDLTPLFCAADSVFFDDPRVPVALRREETLAQGAPRCAFRLGFKPEVPS
jgi:hypothetical protein